MRPRSAWLLLLALALILGLLGVAFLQWRAMVAELDAMTAQLQSAAAGQTIEAGGAEHSLDKGE